MKIFHINSKSTDRFKSPIVRTSWTYNISYENLEPSLHEKSFQGLSPLAFGLTNLRDVWLDPIEIFYRLSE